MQTTLASVASPCSIVACTTPLVFPAGLGLMEASDLTSLYIAIGLVAFAPVQV